MDLTKIDKYLDEGRSTTPKYVVDVELKNPRWRSTSSAWKVKEYGKAEEKNLAKWVKMFNKSVKPGGVNDHLGDDHIIIWAGLRTNKVGDPYIAEWGRK